MPSVKSSIKNPRVIRLEIDRVGVADDPAADADAMLKKAFADYGHAANRMVRHWLLYHEDHGTPDKLYRGEKSGPAFPGEIKSQLYEVGKRAAPTINPTAIQWLNQWLMRTINEQTSAKFNCKQWCAIIRGSEAWKCFDELPLRIYESFARIVRESDHLYIYPRVVYAAAESGHLYVPLRLRLRPAKDAGHAEQLAFAEEVADEKRKLACSQLVFSRGKFYLMLTVDKPLERPVVKRAAKGLTLFVRPGNHSALRVRMNGRSISFGDHELGPLATARQKHIGRRWRSGGYCPSGCCREYVTNYNTAINLSDSSIL